MEESLFDDVGDILLGVAPEALGTCRVRAHRYGIKVWFGPEKPIREHYDLLKEQRDRMVRLHLQKERLMAFVVHDLKNPLNTIDLYAQSLARDAALSDAVPLTVTVGLPAPMHRAI